MATARQLGVTPSDAPAVDVAVLGSADASQTPASGRRSEVLRLVGRGFLVAAGAVGISLLVAEAKTASAADDVPDEPAVTTQAATVSVDTATDSPADGVASEPAILDPLSELFAPVTDALAPVIEVVAPVADVVAPVTDVVAPVTDVVVPVTDVVGLEPAPASATQAGPAAVAAPATSPDSGVASAPTVLAPLADLLDPVTAAVASITEAIVPVADPVVEVEAPSSSPSIKAQAASASVDVATAESSAGVVPSSTSVTDGVAMLGAAGHDMTKASMSTIFGVVKTLPTVELVLPAHDATNAVATVIDLVDDLGVRAVADPVVAPVIELAAPVVELVEPALAPLGGAAPVTDVLGISIPAAAPAANTAGTAGAGASLRQPEPAPRAMWAATTSTAAVAPAAIPVSANGAPAPAQRPASPSAPVPAVAAPTSSLEIFADSPHPGVGPSVEAPGVSSDPHAERVHVDHPAKPSGVTHLAVGSAPGVNTATGSSASHGDQAVVYAAAAPSGASAGERIQLPQAAVRTGVAASSVPTPE